MAHETPHRIIGQDDEIHCFPVCHPLNGIDTARRLEVDPAEPGCRGTRSQRCEQVARHHGRQELHRHSRSSRRRRRSQGPAHTEGLRRWRSRRRPRGGTRTSRPLQGLRVRTRDWWSARRPRAGGLSADSACSKNSTDRSFRNRFPRATHASWWAPCQHSARAMKSSRTHRAARLMEASGTTASEPWNPHPTSAVDVGTRQVRQIGSARRSRVDGHVIAPLRGTEQSHPPEIV